VVATLPPTNTKALADRISQNIALLMKQPILHTSQVIMDDLSYVKLSAEKFTKRLEQVYAASETFDDRVIHELRSPLSVMVGYLELIQESIGAEIGLTSLDALTINLLDDLYQDSLSICTALEQQYKR
jgi:signal transduction histidine kinase